MRYFALFLLCLCGCTASVGLQSHVPGFESRNTSAPAYVQPEVAPQPTLAKPGQAQLLQPETQTK